MNGAPSRFAERWPRVVALCLAAAIARHAWAAVSVATLPRTIGTLDWTALALAEFALLLVTLQAPERFQLRRFRLVGVAVAANAVVILFPLPEVLEIYDAFVPEAMVLSIAGGVLAMALVFAATARWSTAPEPPLAGGPPSTRNEIALPLGIVLVALVVLPVWFATAGVPPLFSLLTGGGSNLAFERQAALSQLEQPVLRLLFGMLRNLWLMFAAGWFVAAAATTPRFFWHRRSTAELVAFGVAGLGVFVALLTTERAIVGELLVVCAVAFLVVRGRELSSRVVGVLAGASLLFPFAVGVLGGAGNSLEVVGGLRRRALFLPTEVMTRYFVEFPQFHEFLAGAAVPKFSLLTGGEPFDLSTHIYLRYYQRSEGLVGSANGSMFGVGWANFGVAGVVLWGALAAGILVLLDRWLDRLPARSGAALRGLGVVLAVLTTSADVFRSVLGFAPGMLDLLVVVWVVGWFSRRRSVPRAEPEGALASIDPRPVATSEAVRETETT